MVGTFCANCTATGYPSFISKTVPLKWFLKVCKKVNSFFLGSQRTYIFLIKAKIIILLTDVMCF